MTLSEIIAAFPERLMAGIRPQRLMYIKRPGCAVHNRPFDTPAPGAVLLLNDGQIAVYPHEPPPGEMNRENITLTAVYSQPGSNSLAVPTGLIFVRFQSHVVAESRRDEFFSAGYEIREVLAYAPQAAWVRACSNNPAEALARISELEELPQVENVEPEMLGQRSLRG